MDGCYLLQVDRACVKMCIRDRASSPRTPYLAARAKKVDRTVKAFQQRLARLDETAPRKPWEYRRLRLNFSGSGKTGSRVIHAEGLGHSFEPVSYTHLDVYKRQREEHKINGNRE